MSFADVLQKADQLADGDAEKLLAEAARAELAKRNPDRGAVSNLLLHLAKIQGRLGAAPRAEKSLRDAVRLARRAHGSGDPRARHARLCLADFLRATGASDALLAYQLYEPRPDHRPPWLLLILAELHREKRDVRRADEALDGALRVWRHACEPGEFRLESDPMTHSGEIIRTAKALVDSGRSAEARELLDATLVALAEIIAGRRMSPTARVHSQVVDEVRAAREALTRPGE